MISNMTLTRQQQKVLDSIKEFLNNDVPVFILKGYAGTGKTTMISYIIEEVEKHEKAPLLMAPTGRAARVLESKNSWEANTIHRCIYELDTIETKEGSDDIRFMITLYARCKIARILSVLRIGQVFGIALIG